MKRIFLCYMPLFFLLFTSCKKAEGPGGTSSISGTVYYNYYDYNGVLISRETALKEDVFIEYGDDDYYSDEIETDAEGEYAFRFLMVGSYTLYAYEDCNTCYSGDKRVEIPVYIGDKKTDVEAKDIELVNYLDVDDGSGTISGSVYAKDYNNLGELNEYYLADERVYLIYNNDSIYYTDMRTHTDGSFEFKDLIPGNYTIYAYSKCDTLNNSTTYTNCTVPVYTFGSITGAGQEVHLGLITVIK